MTIFLSSGCKNGKSTLAEHCACALAKGGPLYYLATMIPHDEEDRTRIRRHVANRAGKGFTTIECGTDILRALDDADLRGTFLLDSVTALLANEMFREDGTVDEDAASRTALALTALAERVGNIVFVSDYLYSDAARYDDDETERYRRALALRADTVTRLFCGLPLRLKG